MVMYEDLLGDIDTQILPATTVAEGRRLIENMDLDLLSLDINLASGNLSGEEQPISGEGDGRTLIRLAEEAGIGGLICITAIQHDDDIPVVTNEDPAVVRMTLPALLDRHFPDHNRYFPKQANEPIADQVDQIRRTLSESTLRRVSGLQNVFYKQGDSWRVRFAGEEVLVSDKKGMETIRHLLKHESETFPVRDLDQLESPEQMSQSEPSSISHRQREEEGLTDTLGGAYGPEERAHNHNQRERLQEDLEEVQEQIDDVNREMQEIRDRSGAGPGGLSERADARLYELDKELEELEERRDRLTASLAEFQKTKEPKKEKAVRQRVAARIERCIEHIGKAGHSALSEHLDDAISKGYYPGYEPQESARWFG